MTKCPICGLDYRLECSHTYVDLIKEFNLELERHESQTAKDKKEIERLKSNTTGALEELQKFMSDYKAGMVSDIDDLVDNAIMFLEGKMRVGEIKP